MIDVRLFHLPEKLPGIGRKRLDIAALALGEDRIEGKRGLAGAGESGENDQFLARDFEIDVLEIVLPGPADDDPVVELPHECFPRTLARLLHQKRRTNARIHKNTMRGKWRMRFAAAFFE